MKKLLMALILMFGGVVSSWAVTTAFLSQGYNNQATTLVLQSGGGSVLPSAPATLYYWDFTDYGNTSSSDPQREVVKLVSKSSDTIVVVRGWTGSAYAHNTTNKTYAMRSIFIPTATPTRTPTCDDQATPECANQYTPTPTVTFTPTALPSSTPVQFPLLRGSGSVYPSVGQLYNQGAKFGYSAYDNAGGDSEFPTAGIFRNENGLVLTLRPDFSQPIGPGFIGLLPNAITLQSLGGIFLNPMNGGTLTVSSAADFSGNVVSGISSPVTGTDASNKDYVDTTIANAFPHGTVTFTNSLTPVVVTNANFTTTTGFGVCQTGGAITQMTLSVGQASGSATFVGNDSGPSTWLWNANTLP